MEEAFFNKDFWRQLVAVLVGAFLGFGGALGTGAIFWRARRRTLARMTRQIIVREAIDNLRTATQIDRLTRETQQGGFLVVHTSKSRPRAEVLQQFMTAESLATLSEEEAKFLMLLVPQLSQLDERYENWEQLLHSPGALTPIQVEGNRDTVPYREYATERFLHEVALVAMNLVKPLVRSCHHAEGRLLDDESKEVASKLGDLTFGPIPNFLAGFKSSMIKENEEIDPKKWLVVWEHDWPECLMPVIELRPERD